MPIEIPGYKIRKVVGKGGMATVYLAEQEIFERDVALKVMSRFLADDPSFGQRFFREAKIVSQLVHPNIVTVYDVGMQDGAFYLSMEYIDGGDLKTIRKQLPLDAKVQAIRDIAKALDYAGSKGFVHRDIKPENIMFHMSDGRAVLMDFGIARAAETEASMTQTGTAIGTPHYMSPEQAKGQPVDPRSDIYSLGVVFYWVITGAVPYDADSAVAIGIKHITEPVPIVPSGYEELQPIIDQMMAKDPDERFQSAIEILDALDEVDIPLIEASVIQMRELDGVSDDADFDATTTKTPAVNGVRSSYTAPKSPPRSSTMKPTFVAFEDESYDETTGSSAWPWLWGCLAVALVGLFVFYQKRPEVVQPWLDKTDVVVKSLGSATSNVIDDVKQWFDSSEGAEDVQPKKKSETTPVKVVKKQPVIPEPKRLPKPPKPQEIPKPLSQKIAAEEIVPTKDGENQAILALRENIRTLKSAYSGERYKLPDLVDAYRALLANVPGDRNTRRELRALRNTEVKRIKTLSSDGDIKEANKRLLQMRYLFPEMTTVEYRQLELWVEGRETIIRLLSEGQALYKRNALTTPKNGSAKFKFDEVLKIDPSNEEAKAGLRKIAEKLANFASKRLNQDNEAEATNLVSTSLSIDPANRLARKLKRELDARENTRRQRVENLRMGERMILAGDLFEPETRSAFYYYNEVLKKNPSDSEANAGMERLLQALSSRVWGLVGEERFTQARAELVRPTRLMGNLPELLSLQSAVEEVIAQKQGE